MYEAPGGTRPAAKAAAEHGAIIPDRKVGALARTRRAMLPDDRLARQAAGGDIGAFEAIFSRYGDDLYRFCVGILREPQDAQDAVQNTMIRAMRALPGERRAMQLKPWLYRIAHNEAVELRRRERPVEELPVTVDDIGALTDERAEENGRLRTLLADIADLPERQRASLVLREVNGLGFGEIGDALGTSPGAVRQALYEARRALAEMDHGRDMRCDAATRMVSDADGRPRDRGVRAHLRDCSPCRRFQAEIKDRAHTFAAISPMPVIAAAGALKAVLGGSGAAGSGGAAAAGGAGAGAAGVAAGSLGASALLKPAAGLLAALAVGTAAVDHGAIFDGGRGDPTAARPARSVPALVEHPDGASPVHGRAHALRTGMRSTGATTRGGVDSSSVSVSAPSAVHGPAAEHRLASADAPRARGGAESRAEHEVPAPSAARSPSLDGTGHDAPLVPATTAPVAAQGGAGKPASSGDGDVPPGQVKKEIAPPGQAKKEAHDEPAAEPGESSTTAAATAGEATKVPPGQAKKESVPPGQAKKESVPPGQAKKQAEAAPEPAPSEAAAPAPVEAPPHVPPGRAKKEAEAVSASESSEASTAPVEATDAAKVPPGQAKKEEKAAAE
jgi:RNA polymerase sigma factor (sigma-70 family)